MRLSTFQAAIGSASLLLSAQPVAANLAHRQVHANAHAHAHSHAKRHGHGHELLGAPKLAKKATCSLPSHPDLVHIPGASNNGFAMSPDQPCEDGKWCPLACVSGKVMAQWKPNTTYKYPESMYGGLYCNGGSLEKPFDGPYCVEGTGTVKAVNQAGSIVSFCQTVLPGDESMLIPTDVTDTVTLAVPGPDYWDGTAAHYYVNPPGVPSSQGCVWGTASEPIGNWSPYVAGANTVANGDTYVKIAWNPIFTGSALAGTTPTYGLRIECPGGGCNGLPCAIDPSKGGVNALTSPDATNGVGNAAFCVVTVPKGSSANIVVFNTNGSKGSSPAAASSSTPAPPTTSAQPSSSSQAPTTSSAPASTSSAPPSSTSSSAAHTTASSTAVSSTSSDVFVGGVFQEQTAQGQTTSYSTTAAAATTAPQPVSNVTVSTVSPVSATPSNEGAAAGVAEGGSAIAGLVVALVAAAALF